MQIHIKHSARNKSEAHANFIIAKEITYIA